MPYQCSAGDDAPVVVHLQQLDDAFEEVDFCATHWVQFVCATVRDLAEAGVIGITDLFPEQPAAADDGAAQVAGDVAADQAGGDDDEDDDEDEAAGPAAADTPAEDVNAPASY